VSKVVYKDLGLARILQQVQEAGLARVRVGVVGAKALEPSADGRITLGEEGLINEFGSKDGHVPQRSFLREPLSNNHPLVFRLGTRMVQRIVDGEMTAAEAADAFGAELAQVSRNAIDTGIQPNNAPATIDKKGFDHPLVETGNLRAAIGHQTVRETGEIVEGGASADEFQSFEYSGGDE